MGKKLKEANPPQRTKREPPAAPVPVGRPSALLDTRVNYCGDNQLAKLPDRCVDLIYIDPPFTSNRNDEVSWGETKEKRSFALFFPFPMSLLCANRFLKKK